MSSIDTRITHIMYVIRHPNGGYLSRFTWRGEPVWTRWLHMAKLYRGGHDGYGMTGVFPDDLRRASKGFCQNPEHRPRLVEGLFKLGTAA